MIAPESLCCRDKGSLGPLLLAKHLKHHTKQMLLVRSKGGGTCVSKRRHPVLQTFLASISSRSEVAEGFRGCSSFTGTADPDDSQLMSVSIARIPLPALPGLKAQERHANRRQYRQAARVCQHFIRENKGNLALLTLYIIRDS
jgi:hypothetical protein